MRNGGWSQERRDRQRRSMQDVHAGLAARYADPKRYPPAALSPEDRIKYNFFIRSKGLRMAEALRAVGRSDLIPQKKETE